MPTPTAWAYGIRPRCAGIAHIAIITGEHKIRPYIAMMAMNFAANQSAPQYR